MNLIKREVKLSKDKLYKKLSNNYSLDMYLFGARDLVGFFIVTKYLKDSVKGYMGTMTHEEYKNKTYLNFRLEI